jgi:uncharacterized protein YaaR (DUF327 family)
MGADASTEEKKKAFDTVYQRTKAKRKQERITEMIAELTPHFESETATTAFVAEQMERKKRNLIVRRTRLARKIHLGNWNYFCTFTYDDKKHTEESFRAKLRNCFKKLCERKKWAYLGVWERSFSKERLHFHGLFHIPDGAMIGFLLEHQDYSTKTHKMQTTHQNSYFCHRFGRNDFSPICKDNLGEASAYLMKYIEKSGERISASKNASTYFYSDLLEEDVVCTIGQEDRKLLLYDDFSCFDDGVYVGEVSSETIEKMRKTN